MLFRCAIACLSFVLSICTLCARAQESACRRRTIFANVMDDKGAPVQGLDAANFQASFRGRPVKILSATLDPQPRRIVLVLDASGSMLAKWRLTLQVAWELVHEAPVQESLDLFIFSTGFEEHMGPGVGRPVIERKLAMLASGSKTQFPPSGRTPLWDAIDQSLTLFGPLQPGDVIYVVSDGGENASRISEKTVKKALLSAGVRVFSYLVLDFSSFVRGPSEEINGPADLEDVTKTTGGHFIAPDPRIYYLSPGGPFTDQKGMRTLLGLAVIGLYREIAYPYLLNAELPTEVDKLRGWKLKLVQPPGTNRKGWQLSYPQKLAPCAAIVPHR